MKKKDKKKKLSEASKGLNKKDELPKIKKKDANGEKQRIPKGYKATVSKSGTIIMVSRTTDLNDKPVKEEPSKPSSAKKKPATKKAPKKSASKKAAETVKKLKAPKKSADKQLKAIKHDENYELGKGGAEKPIIVKKNKAQPAAPKRGKKELRRVARSGGYTVWDGRTGKTFATPKEAKDYAMSEFIKTGELYDISKTDRQVSHTFKAEQTDKR